MVLQLLAATGTDCDNGVGTKLDQSSAEHRVAHAAGEAADKGAGQRGHVTAGWGPPRGAAAQRIPAPKKRIALGGERRALLPGLKHFPALGLRGVLPRLRLLDRLLPLLIALLLLQLLLL